MAFDADDLEFWSQRAAEVGKLMGGASGGR
jgi:hypothetical protein